ncbi:MAG: hypothetical protein ABI688_04190 [Bacteroidota bacterium]
MLSLFKKKKPPTSTGVNSDQDRVAKNIVERCIRLQERWATYMQKQTERLSGNGKIIVLSLFCLVAGSLSIYLMAVSLMRYPAVSIKISHIKAPLYSARSFDHDTKSSIIITREEYQRIEYFRHYMDSLATSSYGKLIYDSILKQRPGLLDSVAFIENIYQLQTK